MWIVKIINYGLCVEWMIQYRKQLMLQGMTKLQELDYLQRQLHTFPIHTNDAIQITFMISRERRSDFCPFFPYRECSVISVLYLCYICAVCPALDFYITNLVTVFVMSWVMSLCTMPHCDVLFIAVSPIDLSPLKFIYHLLNHLLLNDPLFWSDRHRLNYSGTLVFGEDRMMTVIQSGIAVHTCMYTKYFK